MRLLSNQWLQLSRICCTLRPHFTDAPELAISQGGRDRHTALTLLLLAVHEESERERTLAQTLGLLLQLLKLTLRQTAELEQQTPGRRGLATVDVAADHNREMLLLRHGKW